MSKAYRLFSLLLIVCAATSSYAQPNPHWKKIGTFDLGFHDPTSIGNLQGLAGSRISCVYFWDELSGLVGQGSYLIPPFMHPRIYRTTDGGQSWLQTATPRIGDTIEQRASIESIWMHSKDSGYAVINTNVVYKNRSFLLWRTTDGGTSWHDIEPPANTIFLPAHLGTVAQDWLIAEGVRTMPDGTVILIDGAVDFFSNGQGVGAGAVDLIVKGGQNVPIGATYWTLPNDNLWDSAAWGGYPVGIFCQDNSGLAFTLPGATFGPGSNFMFVSNDKGRSWNSLPTTLPIDNSTSCVDGCEEAIYINGALIANLETRGFFRSTDRAKTFKHVGGPMLPYMTRFHVPESCNGGVVVGFDSMNVWITTDGGDGTLVTVHPPVVNADPFSEVTSCETTSSSIKVENIQCRPYVFTEAVLIQPENVFTLDTAGLFPIVLEEAQTGTIPVRFDPQLQYKNFNATVRLIGYEVLRNGTRPFDTTIAIDATSIAVAPKLTASSSSIDLPGTSTCFTRDTTITVTNTGCDTLSLDDMLGTGAAYSFSSITTPLLVPPGESVSITVTFHPGTLGNHFGNLQFITTQQGLTRKLDIPLSGVGTVGEGLLELQSASEVRLPEFSICANGEDTLATLRNTGCDTIVVKNVVLSGTSDYALANAINDVVLPPDSSLSFRVSFTPRDKGARNGTVTITWTDERGNDPRDITITLNATVIDGTRALASSISTIDFGETNICEERDSIVRLMNTGCDTLTITDAEIDKNFSISGDLPIRLAPGESVEMPITTQVDTTGKPTRLTGVLTIASNADNQLPPITLTRGLYYPTKLRIEAVDEASGKAGDEVRFRIILDGDVPSTMTALHFDFLHNNDLLSFESLSGAGLQVVNTVGDADQRQSFTLSPVRAGVLGEVTFKAYLAEAEQTTLSFDNITFEAEGVGFAPECIAVISDSGSRFNYVYTCGDDMIRSALRGETLIKSLTPNPAANEIRLELADGAGEAEVVIVDMLGAEVLRTKSSDRIDVSGLISGTYYLRVSSGGTVQSRRVVVKR